MVHWQGDCSPVTGRRLQRLKRVEPRSLDSRATVGRSGSLAHEALFQRAPAALFVFPRRCSSIEQGASMGSVCRTGRIRRPGRTFVRVRKCAVDDDFALCIRGRTIVGSKKAS